MHTGEDAAWLWLFIMSAAKEKHYRATTDGSINIKKRTNNQVDLFFCSSGLYVERQSGRKRKCVNVACTDIASCAMMRKEVKNIKQK